MTSDFEWWQRDLDARRAFPTRESAMKAISDDLGDVKSRVLARLEAGAELARDIAADDHGPDVGPAHHLDTCPGDCGEG